MGARLVGWLRGQRLPLVALIAAVVIAGGVVAFLVSGPLRAGATGGASQKCGTVHLVLETTVNNPAEAGRAGTCFAQAYSRCEPATLTVTRMSIDVYTTETFTLARSGGSCAITDKWSNVVDVQIHKTGTESCAGLTTQPNGLLIRACGILGDRLVQTK